MTRRQKATVTFFFSLWVIAIVAGIYISGKYDFTAGQQKEIQRWPDRSGLTLNADGKTLVMFVHPNCPCSKRSLEELAELNDKNKIAAKVILAFYKPERFAKDWVERENWKIARSISPSGLILDIEGRESERFGAFVSGETYLFGKDGMLLFQGGITPGRGLRGDNPGKRTLSRMLQISPTKAIRNPVFGCLLRREKTLSDGVI